MKTTEKSINEEKESEKTENDKKTEESDNSAKSDSSKSEKLAIDGKRLKDKDNKEESAAPKEVP
jgi:hypothetical protein